MRTERRAARAPRRARRATLVMAAVLVVTGSLVGSATALTQPAVTGLTPSSGPTTGATAVKIFGTNFTGATAVKFGANPAAFTVTNATTISATTPAGTGTVDVTVTTGGGTSATGSFARFKYVVPPPPPGPPTVTGVAPSSGPSSGATTVKLTGTNFTGATAVKFGANAAAFSVTNATTITTTTPAGTGTVDVTVTTGLGTSATGASARFKYVARPTVTAVAPTSGPSAGGTAVTITGTNLTGATAVTFGATAAKAFSVTNATTISATAPAGSATVDITVTTVGGTSAAAAADHYTYTAAPPPAPTVTALSPTSGPGAGGTAVTITGTNLTGATAVMFGATAATAFGVTNATTISATSPTGTGTVDVTVTTAGGTTTTSAADKFTYVTGPPPGSIPSPVAGGWQLNGSAQVVTGASPANLQLTPATNWLVGSAFWPTPVPGAGITASFDSFIGPDPNGADGLTFTLADASVTSPTALGVTGGGEGFSGISGVAVSLDHWKNDTDPSSNFVGIATTNSPMQSLTYALTNSSIASLLNTVHHFVVTTSATGLTVTMDGTQVLNYAGSLPPYVLLGFTGATGGFNDIHQVQNVSITAGSPPPAPAVTGITPTSGPNTGGTAVTVTGANFIGVSGVNFGGNAATTFTVNSATSITATAPPGTGAIDVTVTSGARTSATIAADQFTYITGPPPPPPAPVVTGINPTSGPSSGGTSVTITGTNLGGATAVNFGASLATITANTSTSVTATAPAGTSTVDVLVTTGGGTSAASAADTYSYVAGPPQPPTVASVDPFGGPTGSLVTLGGTDFTGATAVQFGANAATFTVNNASTITATAPAGSGTVDVTVTTPAGTSTTSNDDVYSYTAGPPPRTIPSPVAGGWQLNGSAQLVTTATPANLQVTQAANWLAGSAFYPTPAPGAGITAAFDAFIGPDAGADGLTFTLADASVTKPTALGSNGGGEGFAGINGIAVSLDHWKNDADPSGNFVGIATASTAAQSLTYVTTNSSIPTLVNRVHHFVVTTVATGISVSMDGIQVLNYTTILPPYVLVGFTGATGGFNDIHQIQNVAITAGPPPPVPTITGVSPASGPSTGGTTVTITGSGLTSTSALNFGSTPATTFLIQNDSVVTATAPAGKLGAVDVKLTTAGGTTAAGAADKFTYVVPPVPTVTSVSPASGPSTGGTSVTLTGTGLTGASAFNFGAGNPAIFFTVNSPTTATMTAPTGPLGTVDVRVVTPGGTSAVVADDHFTYVVPPAPAVTSLTPTSGPNGNFVTITGSNFAGATAVNFGANAATTFTVNNPTSISATTPPGSGTVDVTVTTPGGTTATNANDHYTYTVPNAPTITGLSPSSGFAGFLVSITGTNFTGASAVHFGATTANFTVNGDTSITATGPAESGTVDVTVTTSGGTSTTGAVDRFTYLLGPPPPTQVGTYRGDLARTGYYPAETGLTTANVTGLKLHWTAPGGTSSFAQPIVANNLVYWGDWSGFVHATSLAGTDVWKVNVGQTVDAACSPSTAGVSGTVTAGLMNGTPVVYVPGGDGDMYALNALTGALIWKTNLGAPPAVYLWASPVLYNGTVYEGVSSFGDCPLVQGQLVSLDATTGAIDHVANLVPDGCVGAGVWTSPAVDPSDGSVYVTTGTPNACHQPGPALAPSIVKLSATDLSILSSWTVPASEQVFGDEDFGGTPTLFTATIGGVPRAMVGALNKDGLFFAWDRTNLAAGPVWQSTIADPSGSPRSIVSASWDGTYLYVGGGGATINGASCYGNISALDPNTGAFVWRSCQTSFMTAGLTEVPGLLVEGVGASGDVKFLNTANGATVFTYDTKSLVQGEVTVSNGVVYVPLSNGNLIALGQ
jgi:hypothetical protein